MQIHRFLRLSFSFVITPLAIFSLGLAPAFADSTTTSNTPTIQPVSPAAGQTVSVSMGRIPLKWQPLAGAKCYAYEVQFNGYGTWSPIGKASGQTCKGTSGTVSLDGYFVRAYGIAGVEMRWRVWTTSKPSVTSDWTQFTYKAVGKSPAAPITNATPKKTTKKKVTKKKTTKHITKK